MGVNDDAFEMPGHCWDRKPGGSTRCLDDPGHGGDHSNWHAGERWPHRQGAKPAAQATD